ncbi:MAG: hypothetical protein WBM75_05010 [Polyangiales bacterium]
MFSTTGQATMNHSLLNEVAGSGGVSDPTLFIYAVLAMLAVATLAAGYLVFGRSRQRSLPAQH